MPREPEPLSGTCRPPPAASLRRERALMGRSCFPPTRAGTPPLGRRPADTVCSSQSVGTTRVGAGRWASCPEPPGKRAGTRQWGDATAARGLVCAQGEAFLPATPQPAPHRGQGCQWEARSASRGPEGLVRAQQCHWAPLRWGRGQQGFSFGEDRSQKVSALLPRHLSRSSAGLPRRQTGSPRSYHSNAEWLTSSVLPA